MHIRDCMWSLFLSPMDTYPLQISDHIKWALVPHLEVLPFKEWFHPFLKTFIFHHEPQLCRWEFCINLSKPRRATPKNKYLKPLPC